MYQRHTEKEREEERKLFSAYAPADKSVYICRTNHNDFLRLAILGIISEELIKYDLVARYPGDIIIPYHLLEQPNKEIYLKYCNYGIVLLERLPIKSSIPEIIDPNIVFDYGYMKQQGKPILVLYDQDSMEINSADFSKHLYFSNPFDGINKVIFHTSEPELQTLKSEVSEWAMSLIGGTND